jgi:signal transduction histidine kinase/CheY-like chemotaxis protein
VTGIGALWRRARRTRLGVKLAWLSAALVAGVVSLAFWGLSARIRANTKQVFADELSRNQKTLVKLQRENLQQLVSAASIVTQSPILRAVLQTYAEEAKHTTTDSPILLRTAEDEFKRIVVNVGQDLALMTDGAGRVYAAAASARATPLPRGTDLSGLPAVRRAVDPGAPADSGGLSVLQHGDALFQVAVYPLVLDGFTLGALALGERLDSGFVASTRAAFDGEIVVTAGDTVIAGSLPGLSGASVAGLRASVVSAAASPSTVSIRGEEYVVAPLRLGQLAGGRPVDLWLLQPLSATVRQLTRPLVYSFLIYGALAALVAGIGAAFVARSVLRPFDRFVSYLRSGVAAERLDGAFDAEDAAAEVRTLNESFAQLMGSIDVKRRQLEARTRELASANVVLTEEVHERERVEHALRESEAQLRQSQKMEAIGTLAGGIAHDFNNLLTVISGYAELASLRSSRAGAPTDDLDQVIEAAERAARLTHQLLAFSRKQVLQPTVLDLGEVVDSMAPMLRRMIGEHIDLRIAREVTGQLARVIADRGQFEQVLMNLVVNARDAMSRGGVVQVTIRHVLDDESADGDATRAGRKGVRGVALSVADAGIGMEPEVRDRVFEPFFTTKEPGKGTGLGLSTVYGIVSQSGGTITVDSTPGAGTTFTITLPAAAELEPSVTAMPRDGDAPRGTETILLVEDEEPVRVLARRTLEEHGYTVLTAANADEAWSLAAGRTVDVVLTDVVMPQLSGPQLVSQLTPDRNAMVVMYMSGYADDALADFELDPSIAFLRKPFTPAALARAVRAALDSRRRESRAAVGAD